MSLHKKPFKTNFNEARKCCSSKRVLWLIDGLYSSHNNKFIIYSKFKKGTAKYIRKINSSGNETLETKVRTSAMLVALRRLTSPRCSVASLHQDNHSLPRTRPELLKAARK